MVNPTIATASETTSYSAATAHVEPSEIATRSAATSSATPPSSAVVVEGAWKMVMNAPMGPPQEMIARFSNENGVLKGMLESDQGSQSFEGTVTGSQLKWEMKVTKPMPLTLKYDLNIEGNKLSGKTKLGMFGTAKVSGERLP
jgi:carbon-monoxide dehydrogenase large subunit